ncbi:MAG TPA: peptidase domain-containing ABC transporter [Parasegetibacter sp.]
MGRLKGIKQHDFSDCGPACLAAIAAYYGLKLNISQIRFKALTNEKGTSLLGLMESAKYYGLNSSGVRVATDQLHHIPLPAIAHLVLSDGSYHFVVLTRIMKKVVKVMDPQTGRIEKLKKAEFLNFWSGAVLLLYPGPEFRKTAAISHTGRILQLLSPYKKILIQNFVGAVMYTLIGLSGSVYLQKLIDQVIPAHDYRLLNILGITMVVLLLFQIFIGIIRQILATQTGQHIDSILIMGYYRHILKLPQRFFDTMRIGEITSRVSDAVKIRIFINDSATGILLDLMIVAVSVCTMFYLQWKLALLILPLIPVLLLLFFLSRQLHRKWQRKLMEASASLESQLVETIQNPVTVRTSGIMQKTLDSLSEKLFRFFRIIYHLSIRSLLIGSTTDFITRLFTIILLWLGSWYAMKQMITPGELLAMYSLAGYFLGPAISLTYSSRVIQEALVAADRYFEIIDLETEQEPEVQISNRLNGNIALENISFGYSAGKPIFNGISISFTPGELTGVAGASGSGKSSLRALIQRLYHPQQGHITIDGIDIKMIPKELLHNTISAVPQKVELLHGTILSNIAPADSAPDINRIVRLTNMLGMTEWIHSLPDGFMSPVSEQGSNLSGGQKQRIAIARALYSDPEILILDEATSGLDNAAEEAVMDTVKWFCSRGKTVLLISHRLTSIKNCQRIIVLEKGELVGDGTHEELISASPSYRKLWNLADPVN